MFLRQPTLAALAALTLTAVTACAPAPGQPPTPASNATPHGFVAGAMEAGEAQSLLPYRSEAGGTITLVDPLSGEEGFTAAIPGAGPMTDDGRYLFVHTAAPGKLHIIDTGVWTVEHGDHKHYYRTAPGKLAGELPVGAGTVAGDGHHVAIFEEHTGQTSILSREDLDSGEIKVTATLQGAPHQGLAVPYKGHVLVTDSSGPDKLPSTIRVFDSAGAGGKALTTSCPSLQGHASTRHGVVFGCSDGVLVVTDDGGSLTSAKIPYPSPGERITAFNHRPGSSEVVSLAGTAGLWHLDVASSKLQFIASPEPLAASTTAGNGSAALGVGRSGTLYAFNTLNGAVEGVQKVLPEMGQGAPPSLLVDSSRAYLSHPATQTIHEIDYRDKLRVARGFTTSATISELAETGL
ncbi:hypothetical protein [Arthrobacter sp. HLT1-20]